PYRIKHNQSSPDRWLPFQNFQGRSFHQTLRQRVITQTGIEWNLSPVGRITPKPWREE
uniref:Cytochrome c oxidase subunit 7B, mitochondrial n=1 Tax=Anolis carolinensis TaxID=28377 RepID=H9GQX2_ANOCA